MFSWKIVYIHQIGSQFVGGYWLNFSPTEQETKTSILALGGPRLLQKKQNKKLPKSLSSWLKILFT